MGYSSPLSFEIDPALVSVSFIPADGSEALKLLVKGEPEQVDEVRAKEILLAEDLEIRVELGMGEERATYWTCDLSREYIEINAGSSFLLFSCRPDTSQIIAHSEPLTMRLYHCSHKKHNHIVNPLTFARN